MKTIKELASLIGTTGEYNVAADLWMQVKVEDVRYTYGRLQLEVMPVAGRGTMWVHAENVKVLS
jgi:hypothetical protein